MNEDMKILVSIKEAMEDKKGHDIKILDIRKLTTIADYFVICDGDNVNQVKALCNNVEEAMAKHNIHHKQLEGFQSANWILMDYGDIIVHVFDVKSREFYNLDRMWIDAESVDF